MARLDVSPITQLLNTMGNQRRQQEQQRQTTDLLSLAQAGDQNALNQLLVENTQLGGIAMKQQQMQEAEQNRARSVFEAKYASSLLGMDLGTRFAKVQQDRESGLIDDELYTDITQFMSGTPDAAIQDQILINEIQENEPAFLPAQFAQADSNFQFGAQKTVKDSKGNLFLYTQRKDPASGNVKSVYSPMGDVAEPIGKLSIVGDYGLTSGEKVNQIADETTAKNRAAKNEEFRQGFIKSGLAARGMIPKTKELIQINNLIRTGKLASAQKRMGDLFGTTDVDLGKFNAMAGKMVLDNIRSLGANPTEGERAFLLQITPSIEQGGEVNNALLKDLLAIQEAQVARAKWFSNNKDKTVEQYFLETNESDFVPGSKKTVKWDDK